MSDKEIAIISQLSLMKGRIEGAMLVLEDELEGSSVYDFLRALNVQFDEFPTGNDADTTPSGRHGAAAFAVSCINILSSAPSKLTNFNLPEHCAVGKTILPSPSVDMVAV